MFKAFTAGLFGILFSTTLGALATSQAENSIAPADIPMTYTAQFID